MTKSLALSRCSPDSKANFLLHVGQAIRNRPRALTQLLSFVTRPSADRTEEESQTMQGVAPHHHLRAGRMGTSRFCAVENPCSKATHCTVRGLRRLRKNFWRRLPSDCRLAVHLPQREFALAAGPAPQAGVDLPPARLPASTDGLSKMTSAADAISVSPLMLPKGSIEDEATPLLRVAGLSIVRAHHLTHAFNARSTTITTELMHEVQRS